jgi:hypothetical protein
MITILRYTEELQKFYRAKTKPEPWLHFVHVSGQLGDRWAIYVWDTRQVIEEGSDYRPVPQGVQKASDNHEMLKGAKNVSLVAAFDKRYFIVDDFGTRLDKPKVLEIFNDKKVADAWYAQYLKEVEDINKQLLKIGTDAQHEYVKSHTDYKPGRGAIPQELTKLEDSMKSKFYDKQPEHHRLGHNIDVRSAKWLAQNEPELYKSTIK